MKSFSYLYLYNLLPSWCFSIISKIFLSFFPSLVTISSPSYCSVDSKMVLNDPCLLIFTHLSNSSYLPPSPPLLFACLWEKTYFLTFVHEKCIAMPYDSDICLTRRLFVSLVLPKQVPMWAALWREPCGKELMMAAFGQQSARKLGP